VLAAICVVVGIVASEHSLPDTPPPLATTLEANENEAPLLGNDPIASPSRADDVAVVPLEIIEPVGQPVLVDLKAIANISDNTEPVGQPVVVAPESIVPAPTEPANTPALTPEQIIARVEKSVVFIQVEYPSHSICLGSGFVVNDNGIIATNYHMIEGARSVKIRFHDGQEQDATGWVAISETKDLALIQCPMPRETLRPLSLSASTPSKGAAVYAFGNPEGLEASVSDGIVSAIRKMPRVSDESDEELFLIQTTASISHGSSGGPLVDSNGLVIGVVSCFFREGQNLNFAISQKHVRELMSRALGQPNPWAALPPPKPDPAAIAQAEAEKEKRLADIKGKEAVEALAAAIREAQANRSLSEAIQGELNRILARAGDIQQALSVIEVEGTALTQRRGQVFATAEGVQVRGGHVENQIAQLQNELQFRNTQLAIATFNEFHDLIALRQQQISQLNVRIHILSQEYSSLQAGMVSLDREARELLGQIRIYEAQKLAFEQELSLLRQRYCEITGQ
jgi:S1-C subfamily serine protease